MFPAMRRAKQALSPQECQAILERGRTCILAVSGAEGYPYAVPLNYVYQDGKLYFHCAKQGQKLDAIRQNPKVSVCVVDRDEIYPADYTTLFSSVILFGRARILEEEAEKRAAITLFTKKYVPNDPEDYRQYRINRSYQPLCVVEITVEHMTGKQAKELMPPAAQG